MYNVFHLEERSDSLINERDLRVNQGSRLLSLESDNGKPKNMASVKE